MLMREKEIDHIETIGDLRAAIADVPDDTPLEDCMNAGMCLIYHDGKTRPEEPDSPAYVEYR
ncbi:hypothetical protein KI809_10585 [Geobacter pelophilus]|uniref:Uncharacterized protein n=1 Tax=Geoanaerobacter pelophilus TaxID=60036 RepID=A0AAW4L8V6_9BACT|nr:hypothetical protein [Geoanaerobacter pelophilus]MBT0664746.1 hypothetical protein [Geoanaerobacter pelophilus]